MGQPPQQPRRNRSLARTNAVTPLAEVMFGFTGSAILALGAVS